MEYRRAVLVALVSVGLAAGTLIGVGLVAVDTATSDGTPSDVASRGNATLSRADANGDGTSLACPIGAMESAPSSDELTDGNGSVPDADTGERPMNATGTAPRIVELYPNPTIRDNVGEYLVLEVPPDTRLENWTLTDGHTTAELPNETVAGRVAASTAPNVTGGLTEYPVVELEGALRLAVDGDTLELRNETTTVDAVAYDRAPTAERWYRNGSETDELTAGNPETGDWHPRDATCLPVSTADVANATAFVLPDSPAVPLETLRGADDRLLLAGYTVTSEAVADELVAAADRGVDAAVLFESSPVGGTPAATESVLETLVDGGVDVRVIGGADSRYRYHHPKYAVVDDRVLVTTENWKPSGVGGQSSRGWGVRLESESLAADLATVFDADFEGRDTTSGAAYRRNASFVDDGPVFSSPDPEFPTAHGPSTVPVESAELLLAPDNAERRLNSLLESADDEILVLQPSIADDVSLLKSTLEAARRGVDVRILLGSAEYNADENAALAQDLERIADDESLPLEVELVEETDAFEKIHAKGVVIDREVAVVGSANWNENSLQNNREVVLALHGEEIASYYADVFEADWQGDDVSSPITVGVALAVVAALALAALVGRRYVRFGDPQ
ncbi:phospholipase D-like domain-containing protein [Haloterrigena salifodinae]|uniref:phospholipase D-like domain-containing protein n=1 Tax=Haloterrigena salifodinae TaxID=2675099 RepID=UPI000F86CF7B|nr:phospholipase D-like domain-containing protein [Haloterrigena salifodinae]